MHRIIFASCFIASAAQASTDFFLDANPEKISVRVCSDNYVINLHPIPPDGAWILERNGDPKQRLWVAALSSNPIPESRMRGPFQIAPSLGDSIASIVENNGERIVVRMEYWLSTFGKEHGPQIFKRTFAYGRLSSEFIFTKDVPGAAVKVNLYCHGKSPLIVDEYSAHFGGQMGKCAVSANSTDSRNGDFSSGRFGNEQLFFKPATFERSDGGFEFLTPAEWIFPVKLKIGEGLRMELNVGRTKSQ